MTAPARLEPIIPESPAAANDARASAGALREIVIRGVTRDGARFRPSDWAERLYYAVAHYGTFRKITFNPMVTLRMDQGVKGVGVKAALRDVDSMTFDFLIGFARSNGLVMVDQAGNPIENL